MQLTTPSSNRHVFVYGTLRRGEVRDINLLRPAPVWIGSAQLSGTLYDLGNYPGLLLTGEGAGGVVQGEVYAITPELEQLLDEIEEVWPQQTGEYLKRERPVCLGAPAGVSSALAPPMPAARLVCVVYEASPQRLAGCRVIVGGDWVKYRTGLANNGTAFDPSA